MTPLGPPYSDEPQRPTGSSETPTERNARIFAEATARGEPVFVIRAKDRLAAGTLGDYTNRARLHGCSSSFVLALEAVRADFRSWQSAHADEVKTPDVRP